MSKIKVPVSFSKYGYDFELLKSERLEDSNSGRKRVKAIYIGSADDDPHPNIEVVVLKEKPPSEFLNQSEDYMSYPGTSEWGTNGWTCRSLEQAEDRYSMIA